MPVNMTRLHDHFQSEQEAKKTGPLEGAVLECDHNSTMNDSFSTLGLHSIFSETEHRLAEQKRQQKRHAQAEQQILEMEEEEDQSEFGFTTKATARGHNNNNNKGGSVENEMDSRTLLQKGLPTSKNNPQQTLHDSWSPSAFDAALAANGRSSNKPLHQGNRWLESAGKSVSCRNFGYDPAQADTACTPPRRNMNASPPVAAAVSPVPPPSCRRNRWSSGGAAFAGMSQSCRNLGFSNREKETLRRQHPSATALDALAASEKESLAVANPSTNQNQNRRKMMFSMGKSISARDIVSADPALSLKRRARSPVPPPSSNARDFVQVPRAAASFNGRKFVSYSRSLSCRDLGSTINNRSSSNHDQKANLLRVPPARTSIHGSRSRSCRDLGSSSSSHHATDNLEISARWLSCDQHLRESSREVNNGVSPPNREVSDHRRSNPLLQTVITQRPELPVTLDDGKAEQPVPLTIATTTTTFTRTPTTSDTKPPEFVSAARRSLSNFLEKVQDHVEPAVALKEASPRCRRAVMAKAKSARHVFGAGSNNNGGRKLSLLTMGKSLSARNLRTEDEETLASLPTLASMSTSGARSKSAAESVSETTMGENSLPSLKPMTTNSVASVAAPSRKSQSTDNSSSSQPSQKFMRSEASVSSSSLPSLKPMKSSGTSVDNSVLSTLRPVPVTPGAPSRLGQSLSVLDSKSFEDDDSLPGLAPLTPMDSSYNNKTATQSAWKPSTSAISEIGAPPLATTNSEDEADDIKSVDNEDKPSSLKSDAPVFSTEEMLKEIGFCLDDTVAVCSGGEKSDCLMPLRESDKKAPSRSSLASTRKSQSCRDFSSSSKESSLKTALKSQKSSRPPMTKKEGSKRKLLSSSGKQISSRSMVKKSSLEKPDGTIEKQRSSRNLLSSKSEKRRSAGNVLSKSEKQGSSRDLLGKSDRSSLKRALRTSSKPEHSPKSERPTSKREQLRESLASKSEKQTSKPQLLASKSEKQRSSRNLLSKSEKQTSKRDLLQKTDRQKSGRNLLSSKSEKPRSSRNLLPKPEKQKSGRDLLQKAARKQKSSRKLTSGSDEDKPKPRKVVSISDVSDEDKAKPKRATPHASLKREGSRRKVLPSSSHHSTSSHNQRSSQSSKESRSNGDEDRQNSKPKRATSHSGLKREGSSRKVLSSQSSIECRSNSPSCVALYSPGKKDESPTVSPPAALERRKSKSVSSRSRKLEEPVMRKSSDHSNQSRGKSSVMRKASDHSSQSSTKSSVMRKSSDHSGQSSTKASLVGKSSDESNPCGSRLRESTFDSNFRDRLSKLQCTWSGE